MTTTPTPIDPESLVARIMEELHANPAAQRMLMRALLTREFLGMPLRLDRIESQLDAMLGRTDSLEEGQRELQGSVRELQEGQRELQGSVRELQEGQRELQGSVRELQEGQRELREGQHRLEGRMDSLEEGQRELQDTVGSLVGDNLEFKLSRRIIPLLSQKIRLRRAEVMSSAMLGVSRELSDAVEDATESGILEEWQQNRISLTDIIIRAQRQSDRSAVWVAVEASSAIHLRDIERARQSSDALAAVFRQDAIAMVAGNRIDAEESGQADAAGVEALIIE